MEWWHYDAPIMRLPRGVARAALRAQNDVWNPCRSDGRALRKRWEEY